MAKQMKNESKVSSSTVRGMERRSHWTRQAFMEASVHRSNNKPKKNEEKNEVRRRNRSFFGSVVGRKNNNHGVVPRVVDRNDFEDRSTVDKTKTKTKNVFPPSGSDDKSHSRAGRLQNEEGADEGRRRPPRKRIRRPRTFRQCPPHTAPRDPSRPRCPRP
mmetsp:Transcript_5053/g.10294  ORF Transcript_5053/g.10294 Transcript_5053/m.10294 type:complete len:160 (-) Transcript_5053:500-979(-)